MKSACHYWYWQVPRGSGAPKGSAWPPSPIVVGRFSESESPNRGALLNQSKHQRFFERRHQRLETLRGEQKAMLQTRSGWARNASFQRFESRAFSISCLFSIHANSPTLPRLHHSDSCLFNRLGLTILPHCPCAPIVPPRATVSIAQVRRRLASNTVLGLSC